MTSEGEVQSIVDAIAKLTELTERLGDKSSVSQPLWEEVRNRQDEDLAHLEIRLSSAEREIRTVEKDIYKRMDEDFKRAHQLISGSYVAPFLMLIVGFVLAAIFVV